MKARVIAYYLPQFHPVPENDKFWGPGFTEWTNVAKAKPLFRGHDQPRIPADLGFYDLRVPEVREQQAELARQAGIEGFCYWHYWFGNGRMLLQRPFQEVLHTGKPHYPFCLGWANHDWSTKSWQRGKGNVDSSVMIAKQLYPGEQDYIAHFNYVLPAFKDSRYITVDGKPLFLIFDTYNFPDIKAFLGLWRRLAQENGLKGIYFVAIANSTSTIRRTESGEIERVLPNLQSSAKVYSDILELGFDGLNPFGKPRAEMLSIGKYRRLAQLTLRKHFSWLSAVKMNYPKVMEHFFSPEDTWPNIYPTIMPQWDRSPRSGNYDGVFVNATPQNFKRHVEKALQIVANRDAEHRLLFLRAWNEWGEGNYMEPDQTHGHGFIDALREALS